MGEHAGNVARRSAVAVALTVAVLVTAGCGGNGNPTPATPTATVALPSPTSSPSPTPSDTATASPQPTATVVPGPLLEGPITGPGTPFVQTSSFDLASVGYLQAEYFLSGLATSYVNDGALGSDGVWNAVPAATAPYKTRIVVYRPIDPEAFNGSVVVEWLNVSGGLDAAPDWTTAHIEMIRSGYAWVGVSAQAVGVEGGAQTIPGLPDLSLKAANPARYGTLSHPGDSFSYDIFSQVAQVIRHPQDVDPLGGLHAQRLIAVGESQSAFRLVTYINAIHPLVNLFDGFLVHSRGGDGAPLSQSPQAQIAVPGVAFIRGDLSVPVLTFETETDLLLLGYLASRQADTALFRLWEVAGTAHADSYTLATGMSDGAGSARSAKVLITSSPIPGIIECDKPINSGPQHFVLNAALAALDRWIRGDGPPPMAPRLETAGTPPAFVTDAFGNVEGGIRTPYVDAPIATLSGLGQTGGGFCFIFGTTVPFDAATLEALYPTHQDYVSAVSEATDQAVQAGFILEPDGELIKQAAEEFSGF